MGRGQPAVGPGSAGRHGGLVVDPHAGPPSDGASGADAGVLGFRWPGDGTSVGEAPAQASGQYARHPPGGGRCVGTSTGAQQQSGSSGGRHAQTAQRASAGAAELLWARAQLAHAVPVRAGHRGRVRQHRTEDAGWGDARGQHPAHRVVRCRGALRQPQRWPSVAAAAQRTARARGRERVAAVPIAWAPLCPLPDTWFARAGGICVNSECGPDAPAASRLAEPPRGTAGAFSTHP